MRFWISLLPLNTSFQRYKVLKSVFVLFSCFFYYEQFRGTDRYVVDIPTIDCCLHQVVLNIVTLRMKFNLV